MSAPLLHAVPGLTREPYFYSLAKKTKNKAYIFITPTQI